MKFTINFQNYLTPFFQKYSATLKNNLNSSPQEISSSNQIILEQQEQFQNKTDIQSDNFQDFFNQKSSNKTKTKSNPFDGFDEKNNQEVLLSNTQKNKISQQQDFDFSDIGNPNLNSKYKKTSDFRFENKKPAPNSGQDIGKILKNIK